VTRVAGMVVLSLLGGCWPLHAQASSGPRRGSLVLTGGEFGTGVIERFAALAGGAGASVVYIPSASSGIKLPSGFTWVPPELPDATNNTPDFQQELSKLFGLRVTVLHSRDRAVWNSDSVANALGRADAVWISGGNAGRLASLVLGTRSERALRGLLDRGRVIGGNSAGAIIAGSFIVRGRPDKPVLMARGHERGLGFLRDVVINAHLTKSKREGELVQVIDAHPRLLGIGIDEKAAIVVRGDEVEVIGEGRVAIYDNQKHGETWYYYLSPGTTFDLKTRTVRSGSDSKTPPAG